MREVATISKVDWVTTALMSLSLPEVWDSTGCADTRPSHHHNSFELAFSDIFCNVLQSLLANVATASPEQPSYATTSYEGSSVRSKCLINVQITGKFLGFNGIITGKKRKEKRKENNTYGQYRNCERNTAPFCA